MNYKKIITCGSAILLGTVLLLNFHIAQAQQSPSADQTSYSFSSSLYTSTDGSLPFWFYSNVHGTVDPSSTNWLNEISLQHTFLDNDDISISAGSNTVLRVSNKSGVYFPKLYLRAQAYGLQLDIGRFSQPIGLNNHDLSVGSMMVSHNAMPVPKISISTPDFLDVPFTNGHVEYKGMFSHGWLEEDRYVSNAYLHQKYFYLKINVGSWSGTGGIIHNVQWGGTHPTLGRLPQSLGDYLRVVTGQAASASSNAPGSAITNVIGNSLAAYEFGLTYEHKKFTASLTRLFYLEDKVSTRFRSPWDGVWGFNLEFEEDKQWITAVTYEHINTKKQDALPGELIGAADYYDHSTYRHGWSYENRTIGLPLITFRNNDIQNNVLVAHHLGFEGQLMKNLNYKTLFTYSRNYGIQDDWGEDSGGQIPKDRSDVTPREQFRKDQYSMLLALGYDIQQVEGLTATMKLSTDLGEVYDDNIGIMLGLRWSNGF